MPEKKDVITVRSYESEVDGFMHPHSLMHHLQEITWRHAEALGFGMEWSMQRGCFWVLVNFRIEFRRIPAYGETFRLRTWPSGRNTIMAFRDYRGEDLQGKELFRATSDWMLLDSKSFRPMMLDDIEFNVDLPDERNIPGMKRLKAEATMEEVGSIRVPYSSLDMNGHVNNTEYIRWGVDVVRELEREKPIRSLHITYLSEVFMNQRLLLYAVRMNNDRILVKGERESDRKTTFVMEASMGMG